MVAPFPSSAVGLAMFVLHITYTRINGDADGSGGERDARRETDWVENWVESSAVVVPTHVTYAHKTLARPIYHHKVMCVCVSAKTTAAAAHVHKNWHFSFG